MTTPSYQGPGQPIADAGSSWLARIGSLFAPAAPTYARAPEVTPKDAQFGTAVTSANLAPMCCPIDPVCCPIDPAALAAGQIAIVIPRERVWMPETENT